MLVHVLHERVLMDVAEPFSKGNLLVGRDELLVEEEDQILEPSGLDLVDVVVQGGQLHAADFSTQCSSEGFDFDPTIGSHDLLLSSGVTRKVCKKQVRRSMVCFRC